MKHEVRIEYLGFMRTVKMPEESIWKEGKRVGAYKTPEEYLEDLEFWLRMGYKLFGK